MLNVYNGSDQGPMDIPRDIFEDFACRCGRILEKNSRVRYFLLLNNTFLSDSCYWFVCSFSICFEWACQDC